MIVGVGNAFHFMGRKHSVDLGFDIVGRPPAAKAVGLLILQGKLIKSREVFGSDIEGLGLGQFVSHPFGQVLQFLSYLFFAGQQHVVQPGDLDKDDTD